MLDRSSYLAAYRRDAAALASAARQGMAAPIPSCPGWTMATLVAHMVTMNVHRIKLVALRPQEFHIEQFEDMDLPEEYRAWFERAGETADPGALPSDLLGLYERTTAELARTLWSLEPGEAVWSWWTADHTAGFWQRRMAHETAVHRWDAQLAQGRPEPIAPDLAADGIDETFEVMLPMRYEQAERLRQGAGETYHFHRTDGPGEWLVRFAPEGPRITREHARGDVAIRGSASDLFLFLWQRIPAERLEVFGDAALLSRYFELVPPD